MCALCFVYITHEGAQKQMQPSVWAWASVRRAIHGTLLTTSALDSQILEEKGWAKWDRKPHHSQQVWLVGLRPLFL